MVKFFKLKYHKMADIKSTYRLPWPKYERIFKIITLKEDLESYQKYTVR